MGTELILENLKANNLPELKGWENKQKEILKDNPFVKISDNKSYDLAKKSRTNLLKARTSLEAQDKIIASKLSNFRKEVKEETQKLINITLEAETKQQNEVKQYETILEEKRAEKERLELQRVENIKNKITELENVCISQINAWNVSVLDDADSSVYCGMETDFDFEEYDILYQQAKSRVQNLVEKRIEYLTEKKNEIERQKLLEIENQKKEKELNELKEKQQKENEIIFKVRVNRLKEIGVLLDKDFFVNENLEPILKNKILTLGVLEFEEFLSDIKNEISSVIEAKEYAKNKAIQDEKQKEENQAKLLEDKKLLTQQIKSIKVGVLKKGFENEVAEKFSEKINDKVNELKETLFLELNDL